MSKRPPSIRARINGEQLRNPLWRLNNLYFITNKDGRRIPFRLNWAQQELYHNRHRHNLVLKARQLGVSTFVSLYMLDRCVFVSNTRAGVVAHDLPSARGIFRDKVKYSFENLPAEIRNLRAPLNDSSDELLLNNNSSLRVATSMRSGTLHLLHISEFGAICARYPDRAREVITGSLNTLAANGESFIESTAEGSEGKFFEMCDLAQSKQRMGANLSDMEQRFFFLPWWKEATYATSARPVIPETLQKYFSELEFEHGINLSLSQKCWYALKSESQGGDMKREFPSTPAEAFAASVEGVFYGTQIAKAEMEGRIGIFPAADKYALNTAWDLGIGDASAIWFWQFIKDTGRIRFLHYYENSGEGAEHYVRKVQELAHQHRWPPYGFHFLPHDVAVQEWGTGKTRFEQLVSFGIRPTRIPQHSVEDGINGVRANFSDFEFDELGCAEGLKALKSYRREWNEDKGCWRDKPRHDWASHGADAMRYAIMAHNPSMRTRLDGDGKLVDPFNQPKKIKALMPYGPNMVGVTLEDLFEANELGGPRRERRI